MSTNAQSSAQAKTAKGKRALEKKQPKEVEDAKRVLLLQGNKASQIVKGVLVDLWQLKRGQAAKLDRKNDIWPFEAGHEVPLQFFSQKSDCALFCLGNHNKKRPHNLVLGRMYDAQLLDMVEVGVEAHTPITSFPAAKLVQPGTKPCFVFVGDVFETGERHRQLKGLLLDLFRGHEVRELPLMSVARAFVCLAAGPTSVWLYHYAVLLKKSGTKVPRVELQEAGPRLHLSLRRARAAPPDLLKDALARSQAKTKHKAHKSENFDDVTGKVGQVYVPKQDLSTLALAKSKGVKRQRKEAAAERKRQRVPHDKSA